MNNVEVDYATYNTDRRCKISVGNAQNNMSKAWVR